MTEMGYIVERWLEDGRLLAVAPLTFGRGRLVIGDEYFVFEGW